MRRLSVQRGGKSTTAMGGFRSLLKNSRAVPCVACTCCATRNQFAMRPATIVNAPEPPRARCVPSHWREPKLKIGKVDLVLCSSARRTRETAELVLAGLEPLPRILYEDELYLASAKTLLRRLRRLDEAEGSVLAIGHNPGMHKLALALTAKNSPSRAALAAGKFPTGARASFAIDGSWASLGRQRHQLVDYVTPKSARL